MKAPSILISTVLAMCAAFNLGAQSDQMDSLASKLAVLLQQSASKQSGFHCEGGQVITGGKKASFTAVSEQALEHQGRSIQAARIEVSVDGVPVPQLTFGAVGVGTSREDADMTAIQEWYMAAGKAVIDAIGRRAAETVVGGFSVHAGLMGIRGSAPGGWLQGTAEMNTKILDVLLPHLPKDASTVAIDLKVAMQPGSAPDGQCLINGQPSPAAMEAVKRLDWPQAGGGYLFKQAYVLVR
ncbi:DUF6348 family protein [Roseimicrobium sp. ORNL1]|uniref:DUF6348 family protein n=1 Tax=Roseimicrobium sp. ORNL1 TaxID=2711231 RepID=UPI0013E16B50|nr:DUF6348 family protein [Roseimicrobium sp. ORNL1]QIF02808.1 hypothetical protein G5S37_15180 [Roseimicrobium sp. ORNL1]